MIPYYEHQIMTAVCENDESKVVKLAKTYHLNLNYRSVLDGWTCADLYLSSFHVVLGKLLFSFLFVFFIFRSDSHYNHNI